MTAYTQAVLLGADSGTLVYAFTSLGGDGRKGRLAFHLNRRTRRGKTNSFRSASYVECYNLRESNYVLLYGDLEERE